MRKEKFVYNTQTLRYEKVVEPLNVKIFKAFGFLSAVLVTASIMVAMFYHFFPSPKEEALIREINKYKAEYEDVNNDLAFMSKVLENIQKRDAIVVSLHTHNDRGCAVASAELAVMGGAQRVEGTLLGNGERTGNMDIVVMAMNLYSQGIDPQLDLQDMDKIVSVVRECTQIDVHPRQPYSGDLVFTAFSGSHQDAIKKCLDIYKEGETWEIAYLPIDPRDLGRTYQDVIRVNSQSGKGGIAYVLANKFGFELPRWLQIEFSRVVQQVTEVSGQEIQPDEIWNLINQHYLNSDKVISLEDFSIEKVEGRETFNAKIDYFGKELAIRGEGDGVLNAFVTGLKEAINIDFEIMEYGEHALGQGADAEAVTYIQLKSGGRRYSGVAISKDIIASSLNALMGAASQLLSEQRVAA